MTRDMELVRKILLAMEDSPAGFVQHVALDGYDEKTIGYHVHLMEQAELLTAHNVTTMGDDTPQSRPSSITWAGHEFIAASREPAVWDRGYALARKAGNTTFPIIVQALTNIAIEKLKGSL